MFCLAGAQVVLPSEVLHDGWVGVVGGRIAAVGSGRPPGPSVDLAGRWLLAGFVDLHVHGGDGHSVLEGDPDAASAVVAFHRRHGTTKTLLSLVTAPIDDLAGAASALAGLVEGDRRDGRPGSIAGLHFEGPFLSHARCGAQDPRWMCDPDPVAAEHLLEAARGTARQMTFAPERPGGMALIDQLRGAGVVAAVGHTDATYAQTAAAFAAGATHVTHLANGMPPYHHREPGPVGAALAAPGISCEVIVDGAHLHPSFVLAAAQLKGPDGLVLITDAIAAAGAPDGEYQLGGRAIDVGDGVARLRSSGALAGSTLTMDVAFRRTVEAGVSVVDASRMASATPARVVGADAWSGSLEVGKDADLVVMDAGWDVDAVVVGGELVALGGARSPTADLAAIATEDVS